MIEKIKRIADVDEDYSELKDKINEIIEQLNNKEKLDKYIRNINR